MWIYPIFSLVTTVWMSSISYNHRIYACYAGSKKFFVEGLLKNLN